jgi:hypothetical protein
MSHDWLPARRDEQLALAKTWATELPKDNGAWTVNPGQIVGLNSLITAAQAAIDALESGTAGAVDKAKAREAMSNLTKYMRDLHKRNFFTPPMQDSDWIRLGLRPRDLIRTPHVEVSEVVEFELKLREIREILVNFWVKGAAHKAHVKRMNATLIVFNRRLQGFFRS